MKKVAAAVLVLAIIILLCDSTPVQNPVYMHVVKIRAVIGQDAIIPCGQKKIFLDGSEAYVSWMKNDRELIYRFPLSDTNEDGHSSSNEICYKSPEVGPCRERTSLFLPRVTNGDSGEYRCRIHYQGSPSIDYTFELIIVDKPGFPNVYDEHGNTLTNTFVGPIPLGANLTLICEVKDDRLETRVFWTRGEDLIVPSMSVGPPFKTTILRIINASRNEHEARYSCVSQAGDVTDPLKNTLEIRMYLPPLSVKININEGNKFEAGNPRVVDCIVVGSVPAPTVQWYLDDNRLKTYSHKESSGFNVTLSTMTFTPKRSDDNKILSCKANNPYFKDVFSSSVRLTVGYKPVCVQTLKQNLNIKSNKIEKVTCSVDAVPPPIVFTWNFSNYKSVETPVEATDIPFRYKSVLSWIPHDEDIGKLACSAINVYGKQEEPCMFDVQYKVQDPCPPGDRGEGCAHGDAAVVSGPPRRNGHNNGDAFISAAPPGTNEKNNGNNEFRLSNIAFEVACVATLFLLVVITLFAVCHMCCCCNQLKLSRTPLASPVDFGVDDTESTYCRDAELDQQNCPIHGATIHLNKSVPVSSSTCGRSNASKGPHSSPSAHSPPLFQLHSFHV